MLINEIILLENENMVTLYRGDSSKIQSFSTDASSGLGLLLFGTGIYLTDDPDVAIDYTLKPNKGYGDEHDIFPVNETYLTEFDLYKAYLKDDIEKNTNWLDEFNQLKLNYENTITMYLNDNPDMRNSDERANLEKTERENFIRESKALFSEYLKKAKTKFKQSNLETFKKTTGEWVIIKPSHVSVVSHFSIPKSYLDKTFHADRPMNNKEMKFIYTTFNDLTHGRGDFRDKDNNRISFLDWINLYKKEGVHRAWGDDTDIIGGNGQNPTLGNILNDTFNGRNHIESIKKIMIEHGYVGIQYNGGARVGSLTLGGGGIPHKAYVLWDDDYVNSTKVISSFPDFRPPNISKLNRISKDITR